VQIGENVLLDVIIAKGSTQAALAWYYNHTEVVDAFPKVFKTENGSLALMSVSSLDLGIWELRDSGTQGCIALYNLTRSTGMQIGAFKCRPQGRLLYCGSQPYVLRAPWCY